MIHEQHFCYIVIQDLKFSHSFAGVVISPRFYFLVYSSAIQLLGGPVSNKKFISYDKSSAREIYAQSEESRKYLFA